MFFPFHVKGRDKTGRNVVTNVLIELIRVLLYNIRYVVNNIKEQKKI